MERRKFVIGLGSLAAGGAAATGTGALGNVEAERDVSVNVANDPNAYVGLETTSGADFAEKTGGTLEFNFDEDGGGTGNGLNANADTYTGPEVMVSNQGTDPFLLLIDASDVNSKLDTGKMSFYVHGTSYPKNDIRHPTSPDQGEGTWVEKPLTGSPPNTGKEGVVLKSGSSVKIGIGFEDITENPANVNIDEGSITIHAITDESQNYPNSGPSDQNSSDGVLPIVLGDDSGGYYNGVQYSNSEFDSS